MDAQTISFKGCVDLFENRTYTFSTNATDAQNKKIYITAPVDGAENCGGLGTCEFKIQWNNTLTRWEFLADSGNGDFVNPYLIYYNSTGNNTVNNPPTNTFGTWVENTSVTENNCGGNLSSTNSEMSGDVHDTYLAVNQLDGAKIQIFPNPVSHYLTISGIKSAKSYAIYDVSGKLVISATFSQKIDVSQLSSGMYFLKIDNNDTPQLLKFMKK